MSTQHGAESETYNPWSIVNLVFTHLADQGLHPTLGDSGDPGPPARALLLALGIEPAPEGNREVKRSISAHLAEIRAVMLDEAAPSIEPEPSHSETPADPEARFHGR